ncbi:MAG: P-loop NTPase fold protein, partial [Nitrospira sp.]
QGWGAGDNGTLLHTTDGGATWSPQASGTQANLTSLHVLPDGKQGWVAGDNGTLLHTTDGGATWSNAVHYGIGLAPWYFVVGWLCPLGLLWVAHQVQRGEKPLVQEESVADRLISDRPLQLGDPDPLKFGHIAMALSRFIRNEKTDPPLTIAVTGAWGTGKSSLMNLVKGDLEQYGFRPVWFNVWHHQKEEQLLASLLESIRRQAVPPWWQPEHVGFRWRLFTTRFKDHWPLALLIVFVAGLCGGYFLIDPQKRWGHVVEFASNIVKLKLPDDLSQVLSILGLGGTLTPLIALWKGFTTFGLNPAGLLASLSKGASVGDLSVQAGFRERFATEFHEVTQALHPRTMLILIDDLDRCRPEKVLEVLEAINFLVSSGECFVVMGLDLERVERCVGLGFKDVAEELLDDPPPSESQTKETGKQRRTEFARQYMEKLINIEVPVPVMKETESIRLVTDSGMTEIDSYRQWKHPVIPVLKFWRGLLLPITAFAALYLGMWVGMKWFSESPSSLTNIPPPSLSNASQSRSDTNPRVSQAPPPEQRSALLNENSITFSPGETGRPLPWIWVPIASLLLGTGAFLFRTSPGVVVKDSPEFEKALRVWLPLISGKRQTPRSIKRFVNKVRYLAMLQRRREHEPARWEWANNWIGLKPSPNQAQVEAEGASNIPEASLVALSAIQQLCPQWIQSNTLYNISTFIGGDSDQEGATPRRLIRGRIEEHEKQFGAWKNTTDYHEQFLTISGKIRTT